MTQDGVALYLDGAQALREGRVAAAIGMLRRAAAALPDHQDSRLMLANALARRDPAEAIAIYAALPDHAAAQANLSTMLLVAGTPAEALAAARRAMALAPDQPAIRAAVAAAALAADEPATALAAIDGPPGPETAFYRGTALLRLNCLQEARRALEVAVAQRPAHPEAWQNLGGTLTALDAFEESEAALRRLCELRPGSPVAWLNVAYLYEQWGNAPAQLAALDRAMALAPHDALIRYRRGLALLLSGAWAEGFAEQEWRRAPHHELPPRPDLPGPRWTGEDLRGKTILLRAEQGYGDTIQCCRYAQLLRDRGATVGALPQTGLAPLAARVPGFAWVIAPGYPQPPYDFWCDMMSLPHLCATTQGSVPGPGGYIDIPHATGGGVGIAWAGNAAHVNDRRRSLPPQALARLLAIPDVPFVSLQHGPRAADGVAHGVADASAVLTDWSATAARIAALDLVISVDTAVAHLAGAMGKPVWLLLNHMGEWRWGTQGETTPWYASMRLLRQTATGDWEGVIARVAQALAA